MKDIKFNMVVFAMAYLVARGGGGSSTPAPAGDTTNDRLVGG